MNVVRDQSTPAVHEPSNCLKPVCDAVWIVDGPQVGTRLVVHSPTPLTALWLL